MPQRPSLLDAIDELQPAPTLQPKPTSLVPDDDENLLLKTTLRTAQATSPDTGTRVLQQQLRTGLPAPLIERNLDAIEQKSREEGFNAEEFRKTYPGLAEWLKDPVRAKAAHDDLGTLATIERAVKDFGIDTATGIVAMPEGAVGVLDILTAPVRAAADAMSGQRMDTPTQALAKLGYQPAETRRILAGYYSDQRQRANRSISEAEGILDTIAAVFEQPEVVVGTVLQAIPSMLGGGVAGRALGLVGKAGPMLGAAMGEGVITAGQQAVQTQEETGGLSLSQAGLAAVAGAATGALGAVGGRIARALGIEDVDSLLAGAVRDQTTRHGLTYTVLTTAFQEGFLEELPQSVSEQALANVSAGRDITDGISQAAVLGALAGAVMGGAGGLLPGAKLAALNKAIEESKVGGRSREVLADFVASAASASGVSRVYAPIDEFLTYFQEAGVDPAQFAEQLTGDPNAFADAVASGGVLDIPVENYARVVVGSGHENFFAKNLRLSDPARLTEEETKTALASQDAALATEGAASPVEQFRDALVQGMTSTGRVQPLVAEAVADSFVAVFPTLAERAGVNVEDIIARWAPKFGIELVKSGDAALEQQSPFTDKTRVFTAGKKVKLSGMYVAQQVPEGAIVVTSKQGHVTLTARDDGYAWVSHSRVDETARGQGEGQRLYLAALRAAQAAGLKGVMRGDVPSQNPDLEARGVSESAQRVWASFERRGMADRVTDANGNVRVVLMRETGQTDFAALQQRALEGGFTYNVVDATSPTQGFSVSTFPGREQIVAAEDLTDAVVAAYVEKNRDALAQPGAHLGAWLNPADGKVYLDVSTVVSSEQEARELALAHQQLAVYNLGEGVTVDVSAAATLDRFAAEALAATPEGSAEPGVHLDPRLDPQSAGRQEVTALFQAQRKATAAQGTRQDTERSATGALVVSSRWIPKLSAATKLPGVLVTNLDAFLALPDKLAQAVALFESYGFIPTAIIKAAGRGKLRDERIARAAVAEMKQNLRALWDLYPQEWRERARLWYDGANRIAAELADLYHVTPDQSAAILAALSPGKDWYQNVAMAERLMEMVRQFEANDTPFSIDLASHFETRYRAATEQTMKTADAEARAKGKVVSQATKDKYRAKREKEIQRAHAAVGVPWSRMAMDERAFMVRIHDEVNNTSAYRGVSPEGDRVGVMQTKGGEPRVLGWQSYENIERAVSIMLDGSDANISEQIGTQHKVRSFYNNIRSPQDARFVTMDTHAAGANMLRPIGISSPEAMATMGSGKGVPSSDTVGLSGINGIMAQAYFDLAAELSAEGVPVLPREVQSVTWEAVRSLFAPDQKRNKPMVAATKKAWQSYVSGKITHAQLVADIVTLLNRDGRVNGLDTPAWADVPASDEGRVAVATIRAGRTYVPNRRGDTGADTSGAAGGDTGVGAGPGRRPADVAAAPLFQEAPPGARGAVQFPKSGPVISVFTSANRSTMFHEASHIFFELMGDLVVQLEVTAKHGVTLTATQQRLVEDYRLVLLPWLKADEGQLVPGKRPPLTTEQHEQFARAWEAFLLSGEAPTPGVRGWFLKASRWLTSIYNTVQGIERDAGMKLPITPEVKAVMSRMLASDTAIAAAQSAVAPPMFATPEQAGMDPVEFEGYQAKAKKAGDVARAALTARLMTDIAREEEEWWKAERARAREVVTTEVQREPVYAAMRGIRKGLDGGEPMKLDKAALVERFGEGVLSTLPRPYLYTPTGGVDPSVVAELFGFASDEDLVLALATAKPMGDVIAERTEQRLAEWHGSTLSDQDAIRRQAEALVASEHSEAVVRAELGALRVLQRNARPSVKAVTDARKQALRDGLARLRGLSFDPARLAQWASMQVGGLVLQRVSASRYLSVSQRASFRSAEAAAKGDYETALEQKQIQLANLALFREATAIRQEIEDAHQRFDKMFGKDEVMAKRRDIAFVQAARALAAKFFWPGSGRETRVDEALALIKTHDPETHALLEQQLLPALGAGDTLAKLTPHQARAVIAAIDGLWEQSRRRRQVLIDGELMDRTLIVADLSQKLTLLGLGPARTELKTGLLGTRAWFTRVEHWISHLDRQEFGGSFRKYLFTPITTATANYRLAKHATLTEYLGYVKAIEHTFTRGPVAAPELGFTFPSRAALVHAVLHTGNESNLRKLLVGYNWGTIDQNGVLDTARWDAFLARAQKEGLVTKADYDFAQQVWSMNERLKAGAQQAHKDIYGRFFGEVTAAPVTTPWGRYAGGYVPAVLDPFASADGSSKVDLDALEGIHPTMFPAPGFTKSRNESYAQPLSLDLSMLPAHLDKVLKFTHIMPTAKDVARLVGDHAMKAALHAYDPAVVGNLLHPWLQRAVSQRVSVSSTTSGGRFADTIFRGLRQRTGLNMMVGHVINVMQQFTGLSPVLTRVKPRYVRSALARYVMSPKAFAKQVSDASDFMRTRTTASSFEVQSAIDDIILNPTRLEKLSDYANKHGYFMQVGTQNIVDNVAWAGAYDQAVESGMEHGVAVRFADSVVRETQGSFNAEDVAGFEVQPAFIRLFTMFFGYFNNMANLNGNQLASTFRDLGLKRGAPRAMYIYLFGFAMPAILSEVIRQALTGGDDDDDDEWSGYFLDTLLMSQFRMAGAMVPGGAVVMGTINALATKDTFDDRISLSPAVSFLEALTREARAVRAVITGDDVRAKQVVRDTLTLVGTFSKVPVGALGRPLGYLADVAQGNAEPEGPVDVVQGLVSGR
jgi:predicted GNAT family acetyltransferase